MEEIKIGSSGGCKLEFANKSRDDKSPDLSNQDTKKASRSWIKLLIGQSLLFLTISSVLFVGIVINLLQILLLISIRFSNHPTWRSIHKRINSYLIYILFAAPVSLLYCWSNMKLNIKLADVELIDVAKGPLLGLIIPNHSYELDYMTSFVMADQLGNLGAYKSFSKNEIKYLPVLGWALWMSDIIFVKRNWKYDKFIIAGQLDELFAYEQTLLGLFAEGTRWTPEKHRTSVAFAKSRNMKPLKYHLIPRQRGFAFTVRHYLHEIVFRKRCDEKIFRIFNLQIIMPDKPTYQDFIEGRQLKADIYCEEITLDEEIRAEALKSRDEDDCPKLAQLIQDIYKRKDQIVEEYKTNGNKFVVPIGGGSFPFRRRKLPIFIAIIGFCYTFTSFFYLASTGSYVFWTSFTLYVACCALLLRKIDQESRLKENMTAGEPLRAEPALRRENSYMESIAESPLNIEDDKLKYEQQSVDGLLNNSSPAC